MVLLARKQQVYQAPLTDMNGTAMRWITLEIHTEMKVGDVLPTGLALHSVGVRRSWWGYTINCSDPSEYALPLTNEFLRHWNAILGNFPFDDRDILAAQSEEPEYILTRGGQALLHGK
ncbi:uncharacterized protein FOBCDRAFT_203871 [Fusarium oxysporum Fo47]|uniref:uncharacterized protein n=1 Tax=Fusarium oxysporum Fo47 TaxID=660027 RepID=UPI00286996CE|nr:uncharacterized protein FOBCDRAFT_203871 [Fusarium oxysporum Fo47]QJS76568.2 hypothetical protein FOBCDRAFT_203871 [Fusarium oxysporum Fo47]